MTDLDPNGNAVVTQMRPHVYLSEEQKRALIADAQGQLAKRLRTLIECVSEFGFGRGQVLLALMETNFIEYGKTVLTNIAQIVSGADPDVCLGMLRRQVMPEIITGILPSVQLASGESSNSHNLPPRGLWEELLDRAYAEARMTTPKIESEGMDPSAFRAQYTFRLRRERFRNAFRQKLESALTVVIRDVGRGVRQRLSPTISEIRAQARRRRRTQITSEQQLFSDARLFGSNWSSDLHEICLALEGKLPVPEAWRTRKNICSWSELAELIDTDRALRSRVQKYISRRLSGTRAIQAAERDSKAG